MLRPINASDIDIIITGHAADRASGHYHTTGHPPREDEGFRNVLSNVISSGTRPTNHGPLSSEVYVFEADNTVCGFCFTSAMDTKFASLFGTQSICELYMASVYHQFRKRGMGSQMIDEWLTKLTNYQLLFARTLPPSTTMLQMLTRRNFRRLGFGSQKEAILLRGPESTIQTVEKTFRAIGAIN